jgi:hypothetical protein
MRDGVMRRTVQSAYPVSGHSRFIVSRHTSGRWAVYDQKGTNGGMFADRASAIAFALARSDRVPGSVSCAPDDVIIDADPTSRPVGSI